MRLDSPTGKLIATSQSIERKSEPRRRWGQSNHDLSPEEQKVARRKNKQVLSLSFDSINEVHDIYLVFKNDDAVGNQVMMGINEIEFYNAEQNRLEM